MGRCFLTELLAASGNALGRGRDAGCPDPAQIRTQGFPSYGSYLRVRGTEAIVRIRGAASRAEGSADDKALILSRPNRRTSSDSELQPGQPDRMHYTMQVLLACSASLEEEWAASHQGIQSLKDLLLGTQTSRAGYDLRQGCAQGAHDSGIQILPVFVSLT